jgi:hypothetical protein
VVSLRMSYCSLVRIGMTVSGREAEVLVAKLKNWEA